VSATAAQYLWTLSRRLTMPCPSSLSIMMLPCTSGAKISELPTFLPDISGHTDDDSIVFFPHSNVVHMGNDFVTYGFPFIDLESGGSISGMIDAVQQVVSQLSPDVKVIPEHGGRERSRTSTMCEPIFEC
jgi:hypothetical protein